MDLSYQEKDDRLAVRIRAHKEFANFDIADWLQEFLRSKPRHDIFDLGCGDGNHLGMYLASVGPEGTVTGLDREATLIDKARARHPDAPNLDLRVGSMDDPLPFPDDSFDLCLSLFAIYNAADSSATLRELRRVMRPGAELVLVGPTDNNARELYEFNERLTGQFIDEVTFIRTDRLRREILPVVREVFDDPAEVVLNSVLTFPDQDEFLRYYCSTMLYEEGAEKAGYTADQMRAACSSERDIILSKEMLAVVAVRK